MIFYYVRHGDPIYDPDSLTELGHKQAEALAKRFALYGLDEIYCSTSMRARMTAEPTCKLLGLGMTLLDWANEGYAFEDFSIDNGKGGRCWAFHSAEWKKKMNRAEVRALGSEWYKHPDAVSFAKGVERINRETDAFFEKQGYIHNRESAYYQPTRKNEKRVALFAHEGFGKAFLSSLLDLPYPFVASRMELSHSCVTVFHFADNQEIVYPELLQWSNDSHLYKEGIMAGFNNWLDI